MDLCHVANMIRGDILGNITASWVKPLILTLTDRYLVQLYIQVQNVMQ